MTFWDPENKALLLNDELVMSFRNRPYLYVRNLRTGRTEKLLVGNEARIYDFAGNAKAQLLALVQDYTATSSGEFISVDLSGKTQKVAVNTFSERFPNLFSYFRELQCITMDDLGFVYYSSGVEPFVERYDISKDPPHRDTFSADPPLFSPPESDVPATMTSSSMKYI